MINASKESCTDGFQISDSVKKKKKKKRLDREKHGQPAGAGFHLPLSSDHSSIFSGHFDEQASKGSETLQKKSKKKVRQERSASLLDYFHIITESELTSDAGVEVCKPKKKKKRRLAPREPGGGDWLCVPPSQEKASSQPRADGLGNGDWTEEGTQVKKKRAKTFVANQDEASKVSAGPMQNRTDPSSDKHKEASHSSELTSDAGVEVCKPKKKKKRKLDPREPGGGDWLCVPPSQEKASSQPRADGLGNGDWTEGGTLVKKKRAKTFLANQEEASKVSAGPMQNRTDPSSDKHKEASYSSELTSDAGVEVCKPKKKKKRKLDPREPGGGDWLCVPPSQENASSQPRADGLGNGDWTDGGTLVKKKRAKTFLANQEEASKVSAGPMQNRTDPSSDKHKEASHSSAEDSQVELFTSSPCKTQHSSLSQKKAATKLAASTELDSPIAHKHKISSGVKDSDSTDVTPRKPHKHKKSSGMEDSDTTDVTPRKPCKHKKLSGMKDSDSTDVIPRKPHKHKRSSGMEDSDTTDVTPRKPRKHKKLSGMKDSDSTDVIPRKPHKHKRSSGMEDSDSTNVTPRKPRKHKKPSGTKDSDNTHVTPRKPRKHKESSGMEDSDGSSVGFEETARSVTDHDQIKNKSQGKLFPLEDSSELPEILKDVGELSSVEPPASPALFTEESEFLDVSELVLPDLDTATQELGEFIPHVRNLSASAIRQLATRDLARFKNFKQKGIAVKFGMFTKKENDQLRENVEAFLKESGIESAEKLLFTHRFPEERAAIRKLKAEHLFGIRIAEGIPRPWRLVYYRARKIFDPNNNGARYSDKEKKKLLKYQAIYGNNWKKISELMSRTSHSVALKYSQIKSKPKSGPWGKEETKRLIQAVKETLQENCKELGSASEEEDKGKALSVERENLYKGISWTQVEAEVGTRHWRQCKQKWLSIVTKRMSGGQLKAGSVQSLQFRINLIERLYELNIEDANSVDWEVLSSIIGDVPPNYVQRRFYKLKTTQVPFWNRKTFPEIIDYLHEVTLPKLNALLKSKIASGAARAQASPVKEQRKVFQLRDIFQESSDELIDESEDEL